MMYHLHMTRLGYATQTSAKGKEQALIPLGANVPPLAEEENRA